MKNLSQNKNKQNHRLLMIKIQIRDFLIDDLWEYLIVFLSIILCSWLFNKFIEGIVLCISHTCIRNAFDKQFHFNKTAYCLCLTLGIIWFAIPISLPLATSLLGSIPIAFLISFIGFVAQDRIDLIKEVKLLNEHATSLVMKLSHKDVYAMNEDELYEHCRNCGLDEEDCKIAYFVVIERLQGKELYEAVPYSEATIKRKRARIMKTINEQPKNVTIIEEHH